MEENVLSKPFRYETAIERQIYRAQSELERRHAIRKSAAVVSP